jgi:hypothetical protein
LIWPVFFSSTSMSPAPRKAILMGVMKSSATAFTPKLGTVIEGPFACA